MIRILHLTDFHLDIRTLKDWNSFYKDALFRKLELIKSQKQIDFVAFTGDLIDKGGKDFKGAENAFIEFQNQIIQPLLTFLDLDVSRFIICPGNHDIVRSSDPIIDENGLKATLNSPQAIIDFIDDSKKNNDYHYIKRMESYKKFEYEVYKDIKEEKKQTLFEFSIKYELRKNKIGICSLNSSWRCFDENDLGNILIGENQINENYKFIEDCDLKIALIHHQLDWVSPVERSIIISHINRNFDLVLSGHVHEHLSNMTTGFTGSCFHNVSPSGLNHVRTESTVHVNGFTVIDYNSSVECYYIKYNHRQQEFVDNTDIAANGRRSFSKPPTESSDELGIQKEAIDNIKEDHFSEMDSHFIRGKNEDVELTVRSAFIFPPIDDGKNFYNQSQTNTTFGEIISSSENMMFLGPQESGKKSLLYRIVVELVEEFEIYNRIPVFIDFAEIKNKDFITLIKEYTRLSTDKTKRLLSKGKFVLLIDNVNFHESRNYGAQINKLHAFYKEFISNRIIASYEHENLELLPAEIISHCKIPFSYQYIRGLKTKEIKQIMDHWLPTNDVLKNEESLEKLVTTFSSYYLPNNALSVHLYLWSLESGNKRPLNQAVLMEIYIELILEKLSKENVYRSSFDFTNKIQLISMISEKIVRKLNDENFLSYKDFYASIEDYLKNKVGFTFDTNVIIEYLFERKIFSRNNLNEVRFTHVCFKHFFTAKRMQDNDMFKNYILDESRYFNFPKEIDYYTGLVRSDEATFKLIYGRFKKVFDPMDFILENVSPDDYFNITTEKDGNRKNGEPIARNIEIAKIKDSRPSDLQVEKQYDEQLDKISYQREIKENQHIDFDRMMLIMCNVLRNSEGIEDLQLKSIAYRDIIKHNITYSILYTQVVIRYIIEYGMLPPSVPQNASLESILKNMPYHIQQSLFTHLGTQKLSSIVLEKMKSDGINHSNQVAEIEKFLSVALYSDIQGQNFDKHLRTFVKAASTVPVQNYLFFKLMDYLYKRSKSGSPNELLYLDLISDLQIRTQKIPRRMKDRLMKDLKEKKDQVIKYLLE